MYTTTAYNNNAYNDNDIKALLSILARRFVFRHIRVREFVEWNWLQARHFIEKEKHLMVTV